ncbi:MAG: transposase [Candidatus Schekmanbacteria bacterium]|nr:transposase [Candidatus Schekmanbacteria bacterium]
MENPRFLRTSERKLKALGRAVSRKKRGSKNRKKAVAKLGRQHERIANRREDFLHRQSAELVGRAALLATEKLAIKNMTRRARGTVESPGKNGRRPNPKALCLTALRLGGTGILPVQRGTGPLDTG